MIIYKAKTIKKEAEKRNTYAHKNQNKVKKIKSKNKEQNNGLFNLTLIFIIRLAVVLIVV